MVDRLAPDRRSWLMSRVRGKNTVPEMIVRRLLFKAGYRFRLHRSDLPGRPDIALPRYRTAIFVHGCFWHRHEGCRRTTTPSTRTDFWNAKFAANVDRDKMNQAQLAELGWRSIIVWECETKSPADLMAKLNDELKEGENLHGAG